MWVLNVFHKSGHLVYQTFLFTSRWRKRRYQPHILHSSQLQRLAGLRDAKELP